MKPPIQYFGAKGAIADQIVALMPAHRGYIEPYAGSLSVLLAKEPSKIEVINDLDERLITFWRVLRDRGEELMLAAELTPHSRGELERAASWSARRAGARGEHPTTRRTSSRSRGWSGSC